MFTIAAGALMLLSGIAAWDINYAEQGSSAHRERHIDWYENEFPEHQFKAKNQRQYLEDVKMGKEKCGSLKVVFVGLARDIVDRLPKTFAQVRKLGGIFADYKFVIFENDSSDGTRTNIILESQQDPHIDLVQCAGYPDCKLNAIPASTHGLMSANRMDKMARYRNLCLEHIRKYYGEYDYMIVIDMDLEGPISLDGLAHCFSMGNWDMMCANGLVSRPMTCGTSLYRYDSLSQLKLGAAPSTKPSRIITKHLLHMVSHTYKRGDHPVKVRSEFNGAAIYDLPKLLASGAKYSGPYCEHIGLHLDMEAKGLHKMYMNPSFLLLHVSRFDVHNVFAHK